MTLLNQSKESVELFLTWKMNSAQNLMLSKKWPWPLNNKKCQHWRRTSLWFSLLVLSKKLQCLSDTMKRCISIVGIMMISQRREKMKLVLNLLKRWLHQPRCCLNFNLCFRLSLTEYKYISLLSGSLSRWTTLILSTLM